jgi:hypothetical protein
MSTEVVAQCVEDLFDGPRIPGAFKLYKNARHDPAGFSFWCPCGCGQMGSVRFKLEGQPHGWDWNGDREKPTVNPSILFARGEPGEWHGYMVDGVWRAC